MRWEDEAILLSTHPYGENKTRIVALTSDHGVYSGMVRINKSTRPVYQPGNILNLIWSARLEDQLGSFKGEMIKATTSLLFKQRVLLESFNSFVSLCNTLIAEREPCNKLYIKVKEWLNKNHENEQDIISSYIKIEVCLLETAGFPISMRECAVCGVNDNISFVSPKSGRSVCYEHGLPYKDRILILPDFMVSEINHENLSQSDIIDGLKLTRYFINVHGLDPLGYKMPEAALNLERRLKNDISNTGL